MKRIFIMFAMLCLLLLPQAAFADSSFDFDYMRDPTGENISFVYNGVTYDNYAVAGSSIHFNGDLPHFLNTTQIKYGFLMEPGKSLALNHHRSGLNNNFFASASQETYIESLIYGTEEWIANPLYSNPAWKRVLMSVLHVAILQEVYGINLTNYMTAMQSGINDTAFLQTWLGKIQTKAQGYDPIANPHDKINIFILDPEGANKDVLVYVRGDLPVVPAPGALLLFGTGIGALAMLRRKRA